MALQSITEDGRVELWQPWMQRGGKSCWASYIIRAEGDLYLAKRNFLSDMRWIDRLPTQIVLDKFRLVHAGYDPRMALDSQGDKELLWIRKTWYRHDKPVDPDRTVLFGHTTTLKLGAPKGGSIAKSKFSLSDGRPAWIAMDTGAYNHVNPGLAAVNLSTFKVIKQTTLREDRWFDKPKKPSRYLSKIRQRAKRWKMPDNRKESTVADSFGLKALRDGIRSNLIAEHKARENINRIGMLIPHPKGHTIAQRRKPFTWRKITKRARNCRVMETDTTEEWQHNGRTIRLGVGTEKNRERPHLPGAHSFSFYRSKQRDLTKLKDREKEIKSNVA